MSDDGSILCFGEIVWDALPAGIFLGGAPLNVAYHLNRLGFEALPVSRIGRDFLGEEVVRRLKAAEVATPLIQVDERHRTGAVIVSLDGKGDASYEILEPASWDFIALDEELEAEARRARALVYGTLATRSPANGKVLDNLIETVPFRLCDVNLRSPHDDPDNALHWASKATVIKLNDEELERLAPAGSGPGIAAMAAALSERTGVSTLVVTRGGDGAFLLHEGRTHSGESPPVEVADTVGAGDAFTAAFLGGMLEGESAEASLERALRLGGFVAGKRGAQPDYDPADVLG